MMTLVTAAASKPSSLSCSPMGAQCSVPVCLWYSCCFHPESYRISSAPHLITPTFTGRSTVLMLLFGLVLPGMNTRSGMKLPNGTFMKRLLSTSHTEQLVSWASALVAPAPKSPAVASAAAAAICPSFLTVELPFFYGLRRDRSHFHFPAAAAAETQFGLFSPGQRTSPT